MASDFIDPRAELGEIERARVGVSRRVASPIWFHVGLGGLVAQQALVSGLVGGNWTIPSFLLLVLGAATLVALARRSTGLTVAGPRGPRSRGLMAARTLVALACIWGAVIVDSTPMVAAFTGAGWVATTALGIVYDRALALDLAERDSGP